MKVQKKPMIIGLLVGLGFAVPLVSPTFSFGKTLIIDISFPMKWANYSIEELFFHQRGRSSPAPEIVILAIDETSLNVLDQVGEEELRNQPRLASLKSWPWPRKVHGWAVEQLRQAGAKTIAFDIAFDAQSAHGQEDDLAFQKSLKDYPGRIVFAAQHEKVFLNTEQSYSRISTPLDIFQIPGNRIGLVNLDYQHSINQQIFQVSGKDTIENSEIGYTLHSMKKQGIEIKPFAFSILQKEVPKQDIEINYSGPKNTYPAYSYSMLFDPLLWKNNLKSGAVFKDKIVLIGGTAEILQDIHNTPFGFMPGVEIHANILGTLLRGNDIKQLDPILNSILIISSGLGIGFLLSSSDNILKKIIISLSLLGLTLSGSYLIFLQQWMLPVSGLLGTILATASMNIITAAIQEQLDRLRLRKILEVRVSKPVLEEILSKPDIFSQTLGGKRCRVAVLFADIRGFSFLANEMNPEQLVIQLNQYLEQMVEQVLDQNGVLDKFIGDALMAEFGNPIFRGDKVEALAAIHAALAMRKVLHQLRTQWKNEGKPLLFNGIGIHFGEAIAGNVGSSKKLEYTVIGNTVNIAARVESKTKELGVDILVTQSVYELVKEEIRLENLGAFLLKGQTEPLNLYSVIDTAQGTGTLYQAVCRDFAEYMNQKASPVG
jgi:adenylate cyclase